MSHWTKLFFSTKGRISRKQWWIGYVILFAVGLAYTALEMLINGEFDPHDKSTARLATWRYLAYSLLVLWPWLALYARRLHDLGRTGWWGALLLIPSYFYIFFELAGITDTSHQTGLLSVVLMLLIYLPVPVEGLWLGGVKGERGANQYGPDPLPAAFYQRPEQSWLHALFGWKGRLSRSWFRIGIGATLALQAALFVTAISAVTISLYLLDISFTALSEDEKNFAKLMNSPFQTFLWIYLAVSGFLLLYNLLALLSKRLHDRHRSALWLLLLPLVATEALVGFSLGPAGGIMGRLFPATLTFFLLLILWLLVETLFRRGTRGENKYGPDPLAPLTPAADETI